MYINPPKYTKLLENNDPQLLGYDTVEMKYPGKWCTMHSDGKKLYLESKDGIILTEKVWGSAGHFFRRYEICYETRYEIKYER